MVIVEIVTGLSGIKMALDILKNLKGSKASGTILSEIADLQTALIDVQQGIIAANQTHSADVDRIRDLEQEMARLKAWEGEKDRYQLQEIFPGSFAYGLKAAMAAGEPPHWLCANCHHQGKKRFLQIVHHGLGYNYWGCPDCDAKIYASSETMPALIE